MRLYVLILKLVLVVGLCSCNNQKKQVFLISNNDVKYWDVISPRYNTVRGYCFYKNGGLNLGSYLIDISLIK